MNCPLCGTPGAYAGLNAVECQNGECENRAPDVRPTDDEIDQVLRDFKIPEFYVMPWP